MHRLRALFPAEVTGLVVLMGCIAIIPLVIRNFMDIDATDTVTEIPELIVAFITLATMVGLNVWGKGKLKLYSVLIGMVFGYIRDGTLKAAIEKVGTTDTDAVREALKGMDFTGLSGHTPVRAIDLMMVAPT